MHWGGWDAGGRRTSGELTVHSGLSELPRNEVRQRADRLLGVGPGRAQQEGRPELRGEHHDSHDALAVDLEIIAHEGDVTLIARGELHDLGGRPRVEPVLVHYTDSA